MFENCHYGKLPKTEIDTKMAASQNTN